VQQVSLARVRLAQSRPDDVLAIAAAMTRRAQAGGRLARVIEMAVLASVATASSGERAAAQAQLADVLELARPSGYVRVFHCAGSGIVPLLQGLQATPYQAELLATFSVGSAVSSPPLLDPLSPRELDVLRLIAAGKSNRAIAVELRVTLNTVKKHTSNLYSKMGVSGRTQAIAFAHDHNLI
jgi:LuxR family maltose regulon positive regulatory protein